MINLSIIIPHYNKKEALEETWKELLLQVNPHDEIIVVDDHSPKGKPELDCDCTKIIQPPKLSPHIYRLCTLRNYGLQHAKWDTCIILDPDCVPNPRFLDYARRMSDASVLFGGCIDYRLEDDSIKPDGRRNSNRSYWTDLRDKGGAGIWGGVMMFSKSRTRLVGWFDEAYNGSWGAEEHDFAAKCYHSGMRLRYSMELRVEHQYHPKKNEGVERNRDLWLTRREMYRKHLNRFTPYKPAVGVMVITMLRPNLIDQCLRGVFRNRVPLKVRLINNGDMGEDTRRICVEWGRRWAVDYVYHERKWPAQIRNDSMRWAKKNKHKLLTFIDDDILVFNTGITNLVSTMINNPDIYACSGKLIIPNRKPRLLGGPLKDKMFYKYTDRLGVHSSDWVGGGFTIHRLDPLLLYDEQYQTGFNDYDWSMMAKRDGHKLAVTGDASAYHGFKATSKGMKKHINNSNYNVIRYDIERHNHMREIFKKKWDFRLEEGLLTNA